jgi:hypothetical protein
MRWDQVNKEYQDTVADFPYALPPGIQFPTTTEPQDQADELYEVGCGATNAYLFAECAYQRVAVANEATDPAATLSAIDSAWQIHEDPFFLKYVVDPDNGWATMYDKARLGEYSTFNEIVHNDCDAGWMAGQ